MYEFQELDETTRKWMVVEWEAEWSSPTPFVSARLSARGRAAFPTLMREALRAGNVATLTEGLSASALWVPEERYERGGVTRSRTVNPQKAAEFLARTEFLTWYVRGVARRLIEEGEEWCVVYRVAPAWKPRDECLTHEGQRYPVRDVYNGHRARYHPYVNPTAFSIPVGTNCHHAIGRLRETARA